MPDIIAAVDDPILEGKDLSNPSKLTTEERTAMLPLVQVKDVYNPVTKQVEVVLDVWSNEEQQNFIDKGWRAHRIDEFPQIKSMVRPVDYDNDMQRGTVDLNPLWSNYCYLKVRVIAGSFLSEFNFSQAVPNTPAIITDGPITLHRCNLVNCAIDPSWIIIDCNTTQRWLVPMDRGNGRIEERSQYLVSHPSKLQGDEQPPLDAIIRRDY
jgi:hypothetical protein